MVSVHNHALAIQVTMPPLPSFVDGKEFLVNDGPVAFSRRIFCTETLYRVQLPIRFLQQHGADRVITCIHINYEFLIDPQQAQHRCGTQLVL